MKQTIILSVSIILVGLIFIAKYNGNVFQKNECVIAAVVPGGKYKIVAQDMLSGIELYLKKINNRGGINGRKVILDVYDDKGNRETAIKVALEISKKNKALFVLGHYFSSASLAASKVYLKSRIPAITGSATADNITIKNKWFFSVLPNNSFEGEFIANFIRSSLDFNTCTVVYDRNDYGQSLFNSFKEKALLLNIKINKTFSFDKKNPKYASQIKKIISQLRSMSDPGIIFLALYATEGAQFISSLKYPGCNFEIIGPDSFSTNAFITNLKKYPQELSTPGYYSNGIFTTAPFLVDFANDQNQQFILDYLNQYHKKPSWVSATYYDAAQIALIAAQEIENFESIKNCRNTIKNELLSKYNMNTSEQGVCGPIFFNRNGNVNNPYRVGIYNNQSIVPYYDQYNILANNAEDKKVFKNILNNKLIASGDIIMDKTRIVFTGIHINQIKTFDIEEGSYELDFFLWFRFKNDFNFDDHNILFLNATKSVALKKVFLEYKEKDNVTRVYHFRETFKNELDFKRFPFESHTLSISFRHKKKTSDKLIYVPDTVNTSYLNNKLKVAKDNLVEAPSGWKISGTSFVNGIISYESSLGIPVQFHLKRPLVYSTCTSSIDLTRDSSIFVLKTLLPAIVLMIVLVIPVFFLYRHMTIFTLLLTSVMVISCVLLMTSFTFFNKEYIIFIQYVYLTLFLIAVICMIVNFIIQYSSKGKSKVKVYYIFPLIISLFILIGILYYSNIFYDVDGVKRIIHFHDKSLNNE